MTRMMNIFVLLLLQHATALRLSPTKKTCDDSAWSTTYNLLRNKQWDQLKGNPCIDHDTIVDIRDYGEDPEDLHEYLPVPEAFQPSIDATFTSPLNLVREGSVSDKNCKKAMLPKLLFIGLNHAGSTSMCSILNKVPSLSMGNAKEHRFFASTAGAYFHPGNHPLRRRSVEKYKNEFNVPCDVQVTFDCSPAYFALGNPKLNFKHGVFRSKPGKGAVEQVRDLLGKDTKIIFAVKDPVAWLSSNSLTKRKDAAEYICMADAIESWLDVFPRENFLFLNSPEMFHDVPATVNQILQHTGVEHRLQRVNSVVSGRRRNHRKIDMEYRTTFHAEHRDCKERLARLTGLKLNWPGSD